MTPPAGPAQSTAPGMPAAGSDLRAVLRLGEREPGEDVAGAAGQPGLRDFVAPASIRRPAARARGSRSRPGRRRPPCRRLRTRAGSRGGSRARRRRGPRGTSNGTCTGARRANRVCTSTTRIGPDSSTRVSLVTVSRCGLPSGRSSASTPGPARAPPRNRRAWRIAAARRPSSAPRTRSPAPCARGSASASTETVQPEGGGAAAPYETRNAATDFGAASVSNVASTHLSGAASDSRGARQRESTLNWHGTARPSRHPSSASRRRVGRAQGLGQREPDADRLASCARAVGGIRSRGRGDRRVLRPSARRRARASGRRRACIFRSRAFPASWPNQASPAAANSARAAAALLRNRMLP